MPFVHETSNKLAHNRILANPKIKESLSKYKVKCDPGEFTEKIQEKFIDITPLRYSCSSVFSIDSGFDFVPVNERFPSAEVGFMQFSLNLVKLAERSKVVVNGIVNPIEYNKITNAHTHSLDLPIFNTSIDGHSNLTDSIRFKINDYFKSSRTYNNESPSLLDTLYLLLSEDDIARNFNCIEDPCKKQFAAVREKSKNNTMEWKESKKLLKKEDFNNANKTAKCPFCKRELLLIDYLRLHETIDEEFGARGILSRLARVVEQLYPINLIMSILSQKNRLGKDHCLKTLSQIAFILDGPLAIFGEPAKVSRSIHRYLLSVNEMLMDYSLEPLVFFGLTKSGLVVDHVNLLLEHIKKKSLVGSYEKRLPKSKILLIDDEYRFKYIQPKMGSGSFGAETYYGQDIVYFDPNGKPYVINVMYPVDKSSKYFRKMFFSHVSYKNLGKIAALINELEVDIYENALLPIVLAHKYASISLKPGVSSLEDFAKSIIS
ncbi:DNA double-strand break repair nuclease NurA [Lihuaxuella thermophila]|uniref:NurA domain-containing protein n=1 Tax=Lihuaxuella thermophila TaxID=1173111 RepID=A0A1H8FPN0_9BACL|nr:DNA double-strand break repair nuclease NurA [Lihuaxuella thermophila]SEN33662.1 NurA domain-containing protein [Lihuaxuella thermophila]